MNLLFDTHAFLWWMGDERSKLGGEALSAIQHVDATVHVSVVNVWEISIKLSVGKLESPQDIEEALAHYDFSILPVRLSHAMAVKDLPLHHRDPFDRMLVAQAQVEGLTLVTSDPNIQRYDVPVLKA